LVKVERSVTSVNADRPLFTLGCKGDSALDSNKYPTHESNEQDS